MVTIRGTESPPPPSREPRSRATIFAAVGLGAGLALGALFTGGDRPAESTPDTVVSEPDSSPTTTIVPTTTTTDVVVPRLATLVPGILDVLIASGIDLNGVQTVTVWELADRAPTRAALPWGELKPDASRSWLAVATPSRWIAGSSLWVGNPAFVEPITSELVGGPVWHARRPGNLAWVEDRGEGPLLMTAQFVPGRTTVPSPVVQLPETAALIGWWDTGLLVQSETTLQLLDLDGAVVGEATGVQAVTGVGHDFVAILDAEGRVGTLDVTLSTLQLPGWDDDCTQVEWSPAGGAAGALCGFGSVRRFEYWIDPFTTTAPTFVESGHEFVDLGFTTNGLPYAAWIGPIRLTSTIVFYHPTAGSMFLDHPGRIQHLTSVAG